MNNSNSSTAAYTIVGEGVKVFSFADIERTGTKEIIPLDEKKMLNLSFSCFKDRKTGIWYGLIDGIDPSTRRPNFRRITITGRRMYYLENEEDAMEYAIVSKHPCCLGSPFQKGMPLLKEYDRKKQAVIKLEKIKRGAKALDIAINHLKGTELLDFARLLAITPENNDIEVVEQLVAEKAQREPDLFMEKYTDVNKGVLVIINRARAMGLISYKLNQGLLYKNQLPLGSTDIGAVAYLKDNVQLLNSIDIESKGLSKAKYDTENPEIVEEEMSQAAIKKQNKKETSANLEKPAMTWIELMQHAKNLGMNIKGKSRKEITIMVEDLEKSKGKEGSKYNENETTQALNTEEDDAILSKVSAEPSTVAEELV